MFAIVCLVNGNANPLLYGLAFLYYMHRGHACRGHHTACPCVVAENGLADFDEIWHAGFCFSLSQTRTPFS